MSEGVGALYLVMLAGIAGYVLIARVPSVLHTPLLSGASFIHGVVLVGAILALAGADTASEKVIGFVAVMLAAANAAGSYVVTERMLALFERSTRPRPVDESAHSEGVVSASLERTVGHREGEGPS